MENRDFIVFGLQPWDITIGSTCKYTALEISKKNRVLFVNPPIIRSTMMKDRNQPQVARRINILKGKEPDLIQISPTLWVLFPKTVIESINWLNAHKLFDFFNKINERRFAAKIKEAIQKLQFKNYLILDDNSMYIGFYLKEFLKPNLFIYLLRDAVTQVAYHKKHGTTLEPLLIQKSDLTVTNSEYFCNFARQYNPNSFLIGQGCDVTLYQDPDGSLPVPEEIRNLPHPVIGYTGALTTIRLDIDILVYIAKSRPSWTLALVGPEDEKFRNSELHQLPNVRFFGRKNPEALPGYIKGFDVALNPQIVNPITDVNYPLKIDEYLAMGKPVVATKTTFMQYFKDATYLAATKEEYVPLIEKALKEDSPQLEASRKALANDHSWENFVAKIYGHASGIENELKQKNSNL